MSFWAALGQGLLNVGTGFLNQAFTWNKEDAVRQQMWDRDDSAIQRRVEDLKAAGLSPTLAAGSAAGNTATSVTPSNLQSPDIISGIAQIQGIKNAKEENANLRTARLQMYSQTEKNYADMQKSLAEKNYFNAQANKALIDGEMAKYMGMKTLQDIAESEQRSLGYRYSGYANWARGLLNELQYKVFKDTGVPPGATSGFEDLMRRWFSKDGSAPSFNYKPGYDWQWH